MCPGVRFLTENILNGHMKIQHKINTRMHSVSQLQCLFCEMKFSYGADRNAHCLEVHGKKDEPIGEHKVKCMLCDKVVKKKAIASHRQTHTSAKNGQCSLCHIKFKYMQNLDKHISIFHNGEDEQYYLKNGKGEFTFLCVNCGFKFLNGKLLEYHQTMHQCKKLRRMHNLKGTHLLHKRVVIVCKLCLRKFSIKQTYNFHMRTAHKDEQYLLDGDTSKIEAKFSCEKCSLTFLTENSLKLHKKCHYTTKCFYCKFEAQEDDSFKLHCQSEHGKSDKILDKKRVQCMFCEKIVKRRQLPSHRRTHVIPTNQITCKLCYAVFKTMKAMRKHVRIIHTSKDEMEFRLSGSKDMLKVKCDNVKCNLMFLNENLMQRHSKVHFLLEAKLNNIPNTYCILCHFQFQSSWKLKQHRIKQHTTEAEKATFNLIEVDKEKLKYSCIFCDKKFVNLNNLKYHRKFKHKKEGLNENLSCEFCSKKFRRYDRKNLECHIRTIHEVFDYNIDEYAYHQKIDHNNASKNFLSILDSLGQ